MNSLKKYGMIMAFVSEIVALVLIGFFLGRYLDEKLHTTPYLLASGVIIGFVAGIYRFYIRTKEFLK